MMRQSESVIVLDGNMYLQGRWSLKGPQQSQGNSLEPLKAHQLLLWALKPLKMQQNNLKAQVKELKAQLV